MAPSVPNTTEQPNDAALTAFRLQWAKEAATHASPCLPSDTEIRFTEGPPSPRSDNPMVPLDCGHWVDWQICMSQKECPQCSASIPSRLDKFIHDKANSLWMASLYPTAPRKNLLWASYWYLIALPTYARVTEAFPLSVHEEDVYWLMKSLLVRVLLELKDIDPERIRIEDIDAEKISNYLMNICGGSTRDPNSKYVEAHFLHARVLLAKGETSTAKKELKTLAEALRRDKLEVDPQCKVELILTLQKTNMLLGHDPNDSCLALLKKDRSVSQLPGVHQALASSCLRKGDQNGAVDELQSGIANELPWYTRNRNKNILQYMTLKGQMDLQEAQEKDNDDFQSTWGGLAGLCLESDFKEQPCSWSDWRAAHTIEGGLESDDEEDNKNLRAETGERLGTALQRALEKVDESESGHPNEDTPVSAEAVGEDALLDDEPEEIISHVEPVHNVKLTNEVLKWLKSADGRFRELFVKKVERLMRGERSHKLSKGLEGCQTKIFETYLENKSGHRILWTEDRESGILVWYVSAHKKVSRYASLIDNSEQRSARPLTNAVAALDLGSDDRTCTFETGKVYLDPKHHVPLKLYDIEEEEIERLRTDDWRPSLYLTPREREIVETQGTVCVLGRSGTGKTSVISNRIQYDRHKYGHDQSFSQLFVARSRKVCNYVKSTVGEDAETSSLHYWTYEIFLSEAEKVLGIERMSDDRRSRRVDYTRFKMEFVNAEIKIDPLIVWTQIRSFIKGSIQSVTYKRPLTREEYLKLGKKQNRLDQNQRKISYSIFEAYSKFIKENKLWDDTDRVSKIVIKLLQNADARLALKHNRLYVDEVQDFTQAEVAMFFHCCETGKLFMAGDPAQAVEEGVDFRFEDIRMVAHELFGDNRNIPDKPKLLKVNFRSHAGVLNLAAGVLDIMFKQFPGSARELAKDEGLFRGPRPALFSNLDEHGLQTLIRKQEGAVILGMTEATVAHLQKALGDIATVLSIRDSKGLEFDHVILVNFFSDLQGKHQAGWKDMINEKDVNIPELELQLKQLYTAITRCCKRFLVAETRSTVSLDAFSKWATHRRSRERSEWLLEQSNIETVTETVMTRDEWMSRGLAFAVRAEEEVDLDEQVKWLQRSQTLFVAAGSEAMKNRVQAHLQSIRLRKCLLSAEAASGLPTGQANELPTLMKSLVQSGLSIEATKLCGLVLRVLDHENEAEKGLISRHIYKLLPKPDDE